MFKKSLFTVIFVLGCLGSSVFAQKLGYINSQTVMAEFKEAQDAQERLDKLNREWEAEGMELRKEFEQLGEELESQSLLLSEERKKEKRAELQALYTKMQQFQEEKWGPNGEASKREAEILQPVIDKINAAIKKVGEEENFDYIFDSVNANIVYASTSQPDLTQIVLEELERGLENTSRRR